MAATPLIADYDFGVPRGKPGVVRGDTGGPWVHKFNDAPPDWAASTAYTVGDTTHAADEVYVALTTCTYQGDAYTCTTAHTSGSEFDDTKWTKDDAALGPATDITDWTFLGQYRETLEIDAALLASDSFEFATDGKDGVVVRTLDADEADGLTVTPVKWDMQYTRGDGTVKTPLKNYNLGVDGDVSRAVTP